jgi:hypothetical protein
MHWAEARQDVIRSFKGKFAEAILAERRQPRVFRLTCSMRRDASWCS